jgi:hypothetical protein
VTPSPQARARFIALMDDYHRLCGVASAPPIPIDGDVSMQAEWRGVSLIVQHAAALHPERVLVRCELGELPHDGAEPALRGLLQMQRELAAGSALLRLGLDPASRRICCSHSLPLDELGAESLLQVFEDMVLRAAEWRRTRYLDDADAAPSGVVLVEQGVIA